MYVGKTLYARVMEFVPWTSFARIVQRHGGNSGVRTLSCAEQFRAMAFAQLTWRESLRDIEAGLSANAGKLYATGFRSAVKRSTLADANESRDWRIWSDLAALLIRRARKLYANDSLGVDLDNTVYALDSSTIDLCLSLPAKVSVGEDLDIPLFECLDLRVVDFRKVGIGVVDGESRVGKESELSEDARLHGTELSSGGRSRKGGGRHREGLHVLIGVSRGACFPFRSRLLGHQVHPLRLRHARRGLLVAGPVSAAGGSTPRSALATGMAYSERLRASV